MELLDSVLRLTEWRYRQHAGAPVAGFAVRLRLGKGGIHFDERFGPMPRSQTSLDQFTARSCRVREKPRRSVSSLWRAASGVEHVELIDHTRAIVAHVRLRQGRTVVDVEHADRGPPGRTMDWVVGSG